MVSWKIICQATYAIILIIKVDMHLKINPILGYGIALLWGMPYPHLFLKKLKVKFCRPMKKSFKILWLNSIRKKLGLEQAKPEDATLIQGLLDIMESEKLDYTNTFRNLTQALLKSILQNYTQKFQKAGLSLF